MRLASLAALLLLASCGDSRSPGGDSGVSDSGAVLDPCAQIAMFTCSNPNYCDEVYSSDSAGELAALCDGPDDEILTGPCPLVQCCYSASGLFGRPSLHCVTTDVDPNYRAYCESNGDLYCAR